MSHSNKQNYLPLMWETIPAQYTGEKAEFKTTKENVFS